MSKYDQFNPLTATNFKFVIEGMDEVNYTGKGATLPSVSLGTLEYSTRENDVQLPDNKLVYAPINIPFIIDENMNNYAEAFQWIYDCAMTNDAHLSKVKNATLIIFDRNMKVSRTILFADCLPISLSDIQFSTDDEESVLICNLTLEYDKFTFI